MNGSGYLGISKDFSVKNLVSKIEFECLLQQHGYLCVSHVNFSFFKKITCVCLQCRSFGDLTSLNSEEYNSNHFQHVYVSNQMILRKLLILVFLPFCAQLICLHFKIHFTARGKERISIRKFNLSHNSR